MSGQVFAIGDRVSSKPHPGNVGTIETLVDDGKGGLFASVRLSPAATLYCSCEDLELVKELAQ